MPTVQERFLDRYDGGKIGNWEALNEACLKGWPQVAAAVLRRRPEMVRPEHHSKLHRALFHLYIRGESPGKAEVIRALVAGGLDPMTPGVVAGGPLMLEAWLDGGAPVNGTGPEDRPLHLLIDGRSSPDGALLLIERGADVDAVDGQGRTPLMIAARCGQVKVARVLLEHGCDTLAVDATGRSAFRHAIEAATSMGLHVAPSGAAKARTIARLLADRTPAQPEDAALAVLLKDDVDAMSRWLDSGLPPGEELAGTLGAHFGPGFTPQQKMGFALNELGFSVERAKHLVKVEEPAVDIDTAARSSSLLHWAVGLDARKCVEALVKAGADPDRPNGLGSTPRSLAKDWRREQIVAIFEGRPTPSGQAHPDSRLGRLGIDRDRLAEARDRSEEAIAKQDPYWDAFKARHGYVPGDLQFGTNLLHAAHLLQDRSLSSKYAEVVLFAAMGELAPERLKEGEPLRWRDLDRIILPGLIAANLLGRTDEFVGRLLNLPEIPAPEPNSFVTQEAETHAAWLSTLLAKDRSPEPADAERIRAGRTVRPKRLLDLFDGIRNRDVVAVTRSIQEVLKLHRKGTKSIRPSALSTQVIANDATAMAVLAQHVGMALSLKDADLDHLVLRPA